MDREPMTPDNLVLLMLKYHMKKHRLFGRQERIPCDLLTYTKMMLHDREIFCVFPLFQMLVYLVFYLIFVYVDTYSLP
jgi:hypothetical protein